MNEILVDEEGYNQFLEELEKLKELSLSISSSGSEAYSEAVGDGWHDNFAFEEMMRESRSVAAKIDKMIFEKKYLKKIDYKETPKDVINIGDIINLSVKYDEDDIEEYTLKLTGKYLPNGENNIEEISLNSPIGKAIYLKKVSDEDIYFLLNNKKIKIDIIKKIY